MEGLYREKNGQLSFLPVEDSKYKDVYTFHGPVFLCGRRVAWMKMSTSAVSLPKAYSNILCKIKKELGYEPSTSKITIPKNMIKKEELKYGKSC